MNKCLYCQTEFVPPLRQPKSKRCGSDKCAQLYKNEWARNNPKSKKEWVDRNPEKRKTSSRNYQKKNWIYYTEYSRLYSARRRQAKLKCLNELDELIIEEIYDLARKRNMEVDHIVPLKGKTVCGLHVPWNMQLLTKSENCRKSNKFGDE